MPIEISPVDRSLIQRRSKDGQLFDIIDYPFQVSDGQKKSVIRVGITGMFHDPADALGSKKLSQDELVQAGRDFLRFLIDKGRYDPFKPDADTTLTAPSGVMEYWVEHREIPPWL